MSAFERATIETERAKTVIQVLIGVGALAGIYFTFRRLRLAEDQNAATFHSVELTRSTIELTGRGQTSDRFAKAVEQLASSQQTVRIGGMFSLDQIRTDAPYWSGQVREILCSFIRMYVRQRAPFTRAAVTSVQEITEADDPLPEPDLQLALELVCRYNQEYFDRASKTGVDERSRLDLRYSNLAYIRLHGLHMRHALLVGCTLDRARLALLDLTAANLERTVGTNVWLGAAICSGANFRDADLRYSDLTQVNARGACFEDADLTGSTLYLATFDDAILQRADLTGSQLAGASFRNTDLRGADLSGAMGLTEQSLLHAIVDERTVPPTSPPPAWWPMILATSQHKHPMYFDDEGVPPEFSIREGVWRTWTPHIRDVFR